MGGGVSRVTTPFPELIRIIGSERNSVRKIAVIGIGSAEDSAKLPTFDDFYGMTQINYIRRTKLFIRNDFFFRNNQAHRLTHQIFPVDFRVSRLKNSSAVTRKQAVQAQRSGSLGGYWPQASYTGQRKGYHTVKPGTVPLMVSSVLRIYSAGRTLATRQNRGVIVYRRKPPETEKSPEIPGILIA